MGPEWLNQILEWIGDNPGWAGLAIAGVAFLEGLALIGIVIPGIILLFGVGALVGLDVLRLEWVWFWTSVGAILGDGVSFWIGHHYKQQLRDIWPFTRFRDLIRRGELFFRRHGLKSIIIGRFVGPVRPIMPVVAGMMGMELRRYIPANIVAGFLFAPIYLLPGVVFGASIELAQAVALRLAVLLCVLIAIAWSLIWTASSLYTYLAPRTSRMLAFAMAWSHDHPRLGKITRNLVDPSQPESGTLAAFALVLILAAWGSVMLLIAIPVAGRPLALDQTTLALMSQLRSPWADQIMSVFNSFGDYRVLLPAAAVVLAWLMWRRRRFAAVHWTAAVGFGLALSVVISYLMQLSRSAVEPGAPGEALALMHFTLSVVVYGFFAVLISRELPRRRRVWPYMVAALLTGLVGFARLYFGAHWATDLLLGGLFGALWVAILGIAYRRRVRRSFWTVPLASLFFGAVVLGSIAHTALGTQRVIGAYSATLEHRVIPADRWWQQGYQPPEASDTRLNLQFAGELDQLVEALSPLGWRPAVPAAWDTLFKMIQPQPDTENLPLLPSAHRGRREALVLQQPGDTADQQWVMRLWQSGVELDSGAPLWLGRIDRHVVARAAWFFAYWAAQNEGQTPADVIDTQSLEMRRKTGAEGTLWLYLRPPADPADNG